MALLKVGLTSPKWPNIGPITVSQALVKCSRVTNTIPGRFARAPEPSDPPKNYRLQFFYTSHGIVHWFPQQAADKTKVQTAADDDSAKEKGHEDGDAADEKNGKQQVPLPPPLNRRTADGSQKGKHSSTFVAAADNVISGGEGGVCSNFGGRPPGGRALPGGGGAIRFPIACSRKWVSFLVHTLHLTIITPP